MLHVVEEVGENLPIGETELPRAEGPVTRSITIAINRYITGHVIDIPPPSRVIQDWPLSRLKNEL